MRINTEYVPQQNFRGFKQKINVFNPISYYVDSYFKRSADNSQKMFEITMPRIKKIINRTQIPVDKKSKVFVWDINSNKSDKYVLFLHGMAQNVSNYQPLYSAIADKGIGVLALEFRGYGDSSRLKASEDSMLKDIETAYKYLTEEKKILPKNIILMGHSMGGALASKFASKHKEINSLVLMCPIPNLRGVSNKFLTNKNLGLKVPEPLAKFAKATKIFDWMSGLRFNCLGSMKKISVPTYIIQSRFDSIIPNSWTEKIADEAKKRNILRIFKKIPIGGHNLDSMKINAVSEILDRINF